jgi:hypothetical protein
MQEKASCATDGGQTWRRGFGQSACVLVSHDFKMAASMNKETFEWTRTLEDEFIEIWAANPILFDITLAENNNSVAKAAKFQEIAQALAITGTNPGSTHGMRRPPRSYTQHPLHTAPIHSILHSRCYWPCRNPCVFDVELATIILSLF